jgi:hypothetical protein
MSDSDNCEEEIEIPYDNIIDFDKYEIYETKMGNLARIQPKSFKKDTYKPEEAIKIKDQKGEEFEKKIPLMNYFRWKYSENDEEEEIDEENSYLKKLNIVKKSKKKVESNVKIVEWSDGTWQLVVGDEFVDITQSDIKNTRIGIVNKDKDVITVGKNIDKKFILKASEYDVSTKKEVTSVVNKTDKAAGSKVKLVFSYYDKNEYVKDDFGGKFGKPKVEKKGENDVIIPTHFKRKRNRSDSYNDTKI